MVNSAKKVVESVIYEWESNKMTYQEVLANAKKNMAPNCRVCRECNGIVCRGEIPGVGGKGTGNAFTVNYEYVSKI